MRSGAGAGEDFTNHPRSRTPSPAATSTAWSPGRPEGPEPTRGWGKKMSRSCRSAITAGTPRMPARASATPPRTRRLGRSRGGAAEQLAGRVAGGLAVLQRHLAVDDGGGDALGLLDEAARPSGEIGLYGRHGGPDAGLVEHHQVGAKAGPHETAVVQLPGGRVVERQLAHRLFQGE